MFRPTLVLIFAFTILFGGIYPAVVTGLSGWLFPEKSHGSLMADGTGKPVGSRLIGQAFTAPGYFWGRPSAIDYNAATSGGSNLSTGNTALQETVKKRAEALHTAHGEATIPADLLAASASGLDPHISVAGAEYQAARIAKARNLTEESVRSLIKQYTREPLFGIFGEPVVNVLELNLAMDKQQTGK